MASTTLLAKLVGDAKSMVDAFNKADAGASKLGPSVAKVGKIAGGIVAGAGLIALPGFLESAAKAAADDAANVAKVDQALANMLERTGQPSSKLPELRANLAEQIKAGQKLAFTDDQQRDALSLLLTQTDDYGDAIKRLRLAEDVSRGTGMDLQMSAKLLGKITDDNIQVFKRYGITLDKGMDEGQALAAAQKLWGGQAEAYAKSTAGQFAVAKDQMAELKEKIGATLLPVLAKIAPFVIQFLDALDRVPAPMLAVGAAVAVALGVLVLLGPALSAIVAIAPLVGGVFTIMLGPVGLVVAAIAALIAIGVLLWKNWDTVKARANEFGLGGVVTAIETVIQLFKDAMQWAGKFGEALDKVAPGGKESVGKAAAGGAVKGAIGVIPGFGPAFTAASAVGDFLAGKRAMGGPVSAGRSYLVGERGPEVFTPSTSGSISTGGNNYYISLAGAGFFASEAEFQRWVLSALHMAQQRGSLGLS